MAEMSKSMRNRLSAIRNTEVTRGSRGAIIIEHAVIQSMYLDGAKRTIKKADGSKAFITDATEVTIVLGEKQAREFIDNDCKIRSVYYDDEDMTLYFLTIRIKMENLQEGDIRRVDNFTGKPKITMIDPTNIDDLQMLQNSRFLDAKLLVRPWKGADAEFYNCYLNKAVFEVDPGDDGFFDGYCAEHSPIPEEEEELPF